MAQHDTHDHLGGAAQPTVSNFQTTLLSLQWVSIMRDPVTASLVEAVVEVLCASGERSYLRHRPRVSWRQWSNLVGAPSSLTA